ncbi:transcription termination/antitermination protein NusG [Legionella israelensis]|uniref:Transcription termination/antitermination protein NusG n=1 Tax=Legionella israelensis TaxID=454 RepID=A0AAX1EJ66_9GAMM|nr:transcription termination/antitermination protein NusG [Legionella israelensis]QBS09900.1 transcription termination/antitermination protein NusG [Legionella israelensis]QDP71303.1 transcription termination/antitermination protein NusG [Legionella israelensis]
MKAVEEQKTKQWYVVHAYSGYENFVKREISSRAVRLHLEEKIGEVVVPSEEVVEMRSGQKRKSTRKFFPGYVLVHMIMDDETWHMIRAIPRVLGFIGGTSQTPTPITDQEAQAIMQRVEEGVSKPRPKTLFEPGEIVRVKEGPFVDFNGVVEEVNYEKSRLRVAVLIFGRSTPVELEFSQVEKT